MSMILPLDPGELPAAAWEHPAMREALRGREVRAVLRGVQRYGISQSRLASAIGMTQSRVSEVVCGRRVVGRLDVLERIAEGLGMPDEARQLLGLAAAHGRRAPQASTMFDLAAFPEVVRVYSRQADAAEEIQRAAISAWEIDVLAVRGLGLLALNDSLLRACLPRPRGGRDLRLRVLLLHPESPALEQRAAEIGESPAALASGIKLSTDRLAELAASGRSVEVYWYRQLPVWRAIRCDGVVWLGSFAAAWEGHMSPMYKLLRDGNGPLVAGVARQVQALVAEAHRAV